MKTKNFKSESFDKLVAKLKEREPTPDRDIVWKKVHALQINYSRELKTFKCKDGC
jgi:hypothetical protein